MKTVVLTVQAAFTARVLLQTEVLPELLRRGLKVVVLTSDPPLVRAYLDGRGFGGVAVEPIDHAAYARGEGRLLPALLRQARNIALPVTTLRDIGRMQWEDARRSGSFRILATTAAVLGLAGLMRRSLRLRRAVARLENRLDAPLAHEAFFARHDPAVVVTTSLGNFDHDRYLMREAKRRGARVAVYVLQWDNPTVRGQGCDLADLCIAWSEVMREELTGLHGLPAARIAVGGVPHYDYYRETAAPLPDRAALAALLGCDPRKRLILLATKSPNTFLNPDLAEGICRAIEDGRLPGDCPGGPPAPHLPPKKIEGESASRPSWPHGRR